MPLTFTDEDFVDAPAKAPLDFSESDFGVSPKKKALEDTRDKLRAQGENLSTLTDFIGGAERMIEPYTPEGLLNQPTRAADDIAGAKIPDQFGAGQSVASLPEPTGTGVAAGLGRIGVGFVNGLTTPESIVTLPFAAQSRVVLALFGGQMAKDLPDEIKNAVDVVQDPKATTADKVAAVGNPVVQAAMIAGLARAPKVEPSGVKASAGEPEAPAAEAPKFTASDFKVSSEPKPPVDQTPPHPAPAEPTAPEAGADSLTPHDLQPALLVGDKPVTGGETHQAIYDNLRSEQPNNPEIHEAKIEDARHVFVDENGKMYNRQQAAAALGEKTPLQSERLNMLKAEPIEPSVKSIDTISSMDLDKFHKMAGRQPGGLTGYAHRFGMAVKTPEEVDALKSNADKHGQLAEKLMESDKPEDLDKAVAEATRGQFFSEAYGAATGTGSAGESLTKNTNYTPPFPTAKNLGEAEPETVTNKGSKSIAKPFNLPESIRYTIRPNGKFDVAAQTTGEGTLGLQNNLSYEQLSAKVGKPIADLIASHAGDEKSEEFGFKTGVLNTKNLAAKIRADVEKQPDTAKLAEHIGAVFDFKDKKGRLQFKWTNVPKDNPLYGASFTVPADATPERALAKARSVASEFGVPDYKTEKPTVPQTPKTVSEKPPIVPEKSTIVPKTTVLPESGKIPVNPPKTVEAPAPIRQAASEFTSLAMDHAPVQKWGSERTIADAMAADPGKTNLGTIGIKGAITRGTAIKNVLASAAKELGLDPDKMGSEAYRAANLPKLKEFIASKSAAKIIQQAASHGVTGVNEALTGLGKLFGSGTRLGSLTPGFDEKTYAAAKPHFEKAWNEFKNTGKSVKEFSDFVVNSFGDAIKPYLDSFIKTVSAGKSVYGVAERVRKARVDAGQVVPVPTGEGVSAPEAVDWGRELFASGGDPEQALQDVERTGAVSFDAAAITRAHGEGLAQTAADAEHEFGVGSPEYKAARAALDEWDTRTKALGTIWHKVGMTMQGETDLDTGSFTAIDRAWKDSHDGKEMTPAQEKKAKEFVFEDQKLEHQTGDLLGKLDDELKKQTPTPKVEAVEPHVRLVADKLREYFKTRSASALDRIKARRAEGRLFTGIDPSELIDYADHGASKIFEKGIEGAEMTAEWADEMVKDIGDFIKPHLQQIWDASLKTFQYGFKKVVPSDAATRKAVKTASKPKLAEKSVDYVRDTMAQPKVSGKFSGEQVSTLWDYVKKTHIDQGNTDFADIIQKTATELGMPLKDVSAALGQSKTAKKITDELWRKQTDRRRIQESAKRWVQAQDTPWLARLAPSVARRMFALKVFGHGTVGFGTHAPLVAFMPQYAKVYYRNFGKMYAMVLKPARYEQEAADLKASKNFTVAQRAGLVNDPFKVEDFNNPEMTQALGRLSGAGNRGYFALKILRQDMFDQGWDRLPENVKTPELASAMSDAINHITGVVKSKGGKNAHLALFAPRLLMSRAAFLAGDPARAAVIMSKLTKPRSGGWKALPEHEKFIVTNELKTKATILGTAGVLLLINQAVLQATGSNQQINLTDPTRSDFMKFKGVGMDFSFGNPMLNMARLPLRLWMIGKGDGGKLKHVIYPDESMYSVAGEFARTQLSPAASVAADFLTKGDYQRRPLPQIPGYGAPIPIPKRLAAQGVKPYTWPEYFAQTFTPIWLNEPVTEVWRHGFGMSEDQIKTMGKALLATAVTAGTGGRLTEDTQPKKNAMQEQ